ncbi:MAG: ShlB/FhaC/HecB family hemolysin secretion/activation protein [Panacagrimonas sp.]
MSLQHYQRRAVASCLCLLASLGAGPAAADAPPEPAAAQAVRVVPVEGRAFDIREIQVEGNTVLAGGDIEQVLGFFVGENRTAEDVDAARAALEKLYKELGYRTVAVVIPKQTIQDGIVVLQVTETRVGETIVEGADYTSIARVKLEVPSLAPGTVPNFNEVQEELVYANRLPSRRVTPSLRPGKAPGTLDAVLSVDDDLPVSGSVEWNNRYSFGTTEERVVGNVSYDNLFQRGHSLSVLFQTAPQRSSDGRVVSLSYLARLPNPAWSLYFNALNSDSDVSAFAGVNVVGEGRSGGIKAVRQFATESGNWFPSIAFGADYKRFRNVTLLRSEQASSEIVTPATYVPFNLSFSQTYRGNTHRLQNDLSLVFTSASLGSEDETLDTNRFGARGQSLYLRGSLSDAVSLPAGFSIFGRVSGQFSDDPLLSGEQISAGGMDSVRGFLETEALGDTGVIAGLELRLPSVPDLFPSAKWASWLTEFQPYAFGDVASLEVNGPFPDGDTPRSFKLSSSGGGLSVRLREYASAQLVWSVTGNDGPRTPSGDNRFLFRLSGSF